MNGLLFAGSGAAGVFLLYTRFAFGRRELLTRSRSRQARATGARWLHQAGLRGVRWREFVAVCASVATGAFLVTWAVFGGIVPGVVSAVTNTGMSVPQALFAVGRRAPVELRSGFDVAHREWLLTTDFARAVAVLKDELADPSADMVCETLLTAHVVGGVDLDRRLTDLADDRLADVQARKDARAKQAGARFARAFVLLVPIGMALVGLSIGRGRAAYESATGQLLVAVGLALLTGCWWWAGRIMTIPADKRVFSQ